MKNAKERYYLGLSSGDYESVKAKFEADYHKTNPADVEHQDIIDLNEELCSDDLEMIKEFRFSGITENVMRYAGNYERSSAHIDEKILQWHKENMGCQDVESRNYS